MSDDMSMGLPSSAGEHGVLRSMQEVAMSSQEASKMLRTYNIAWWGNNYYDVNELGHISVCPDPDVPEARVDLAQLVKTREAQGQRLPALFCFPQILQHRLRSIYAAFKRARESYGYNGDYFLVYPIKVNQHRRVIESLIHSGEPLGLEAGSKAELMAVLAHAGMTRSVIVCNGYKDREYIRLALIGEKMGHKVYLVIEKMSEIAIVLDEAVIGKNCLIAAGSLVTKGTRIPDGSLVMGSPARIRRSLTEQEKENLSRNADEYLALSENLSHE